MEWEDDDECDGETHLKGASLPGKYRRLAFRSKEVVFPKGEFCAEYFCLPLKELTAPKS